MNKEQSEILEAPVIWKPVALNDITTAPFINKPVEQWSYEEKVCFSGWYIILNNFHMAINMALKPNIEDLKDEYLNKKGKIHYGDNEEGVKRAIEDGEGSRIFSNGTYRDYYRNVKKSLIDNNIDLIRLEELYKKSREMYQRFYETPFPYKIQFPYNEAFKEYLDVNASFYSLLIPVVLDLHNKYGYTKTELSR